MFRIPNENRRLREENERLVAQVERDRQERLRVLPDFLAEKAARVAAEIERDQYAARVTELTEEIAALKRSLYRLPWLSPVTEPGGRP